MKPSRARRRSGRGPHAASGAGCLASPCDTTRATPRASAPSILGCTRPRAPDRWDGEPRAERRRSAAIMKEQTMTPPKVTPEPIMRIAAGFMAAKHLFAASRLGLFEALAESPATLETLAARTGLTARSARISADAM